MTDRRKKQFVGGMVFAWVAFAHMMLGLSHAFSIVFQERAAHPEAPLGYVPMHFTIALSITAGVEVLGIVLLLRSADRLHPTRFWVAVVSALLNILMVAVFGAFMWTAYRSGAQFRGRTACTFGIAEGSLAANENESYCSRRTSRTFFVRVCSVNGFCRNAVPGSSTSWWMIASSV